MSDVFKKLDEQNHYWLEVFKIMPKELQESIYQVGQYTFLISTAIMFWLITTMDEKEREIRSDILNNYQEEYKRDVKFKQE
ncbi:MAG: hypothetical protein M0R17_05885 [Candidatus Omnitrophica bacterium]|jgi:hypothetical protein|nr:hypothetical protein [Candidatus Omnitrophota bacterium]